MKRLFFTGSLLAGTFLSASAQWKTICNDPAGDGKSSASLDGIKLEYRYAEDSDSIWFKITTTGISPEQASSIGVNIMVNYSGTDKVFNFWGQNNHEAYHRLLTAWVSGQAPRNYSGTIGIADAHGIEASHYTSLHSSNVSIEVRPDNKTIKLGLKRADIIPDEAFKEVNRVSVVCGATLGSAHASNDELYQPGAKLSIMRFGNKERKPLLSPDIDWAIYPNPLQRNTSLHIKNAAVVKGTTLLVEEVSGRELKRIQNIDGDEALLDLSDLHPGIYILRLLSENGQNRTKRMVITQD